MTHVSGVWVQSKGGAFVGDTKDFLKFTVGDHSVSKCKLPAGGVMLRAHAYVFDRVLSSPMC